MSEFKRLKFNFKRKGDDKNINGNVVGELPEIAASPTRLFTMIEFRVEQTAKLWETRCSSPN